MENLVKKFGTKKHLEIDKEMNVMMGNLRIFAENVEPESVSDPVIVEGVGEEIKLSGGSAEARAEILSVCKTE